MYRRSRYRAVYWALAVAGLTSLANGCADSRSVEARAIEDGLTPGHPIAAPYELHPTLRVRTEPAGAEVWIGPGSSTPVSSPNPPGTGGRLLGKSPLIAKITIYDLSPNGDLEFSIRDGSTVLRSGRIENAGRIMRRKGRFRIDVSLLEPVGSLNATPSGKPERKAGC